MNQMEKEYYQYHIAQKRRYENQKGKSKEKMPELMGWDLINFGFLRRKPKNNNPIFWVLGQFKLNRMNPFESYEDTVPIEYTQERKPCPCGECSEVIKKLSSLDIVISRDVLVRHPSGCKCCFDMTVPDPLDLKVPLQTEVTV